MLEGLHFALSLASKGKFLGEQLKASIQFDTHLHDKLASWVWVHAKWTRDLRKGEIACKSICHHALFCLQKVGAMAKEARRG